MLCENLNPKKRLIQFNDLVFDSATMITDATFETDTKTQAQEYSYGHGSYVRFHRPQQFLTEQDVSVTINISYRKFQREHRKYLKDFIKKELLKPGKLWAIEDNKFLWANAYMTHFSEPYELFKGELSIDVDFKVYEGVWHFADRRKTFLLPYNSCDLFDCGEWEDIDDCESCCTSCPPLETANCDCMCDCGELEKENTACAIGNEAFSKFTDCNNPYRIVYNCIKANQLYGDDLLGYHICKSDYCMDNIAGRFYSKTIIDSDNINVTLKGKFQSPRITINNTTVQINGDYDGILKIDKSLDVSFTQDACCDYQDVALENVVIENDYGFTVSHGWNKVMVEGICCEMACVYVKVDELTY